jgi:hypothetical protein
MDRSRVIRGLRIAWMVGWGILCVLLVASWVLSYWWQDCVTFNYSSSRCLRVFSVQGKIAIQGRDFAWSDRWLNFHESRSARLQTSTGFTAPYWCCVLLSAMLALIPWLAWSPRFSIRTLLVATTLVALALGIWAHLRTW